MPSRGSVTKTIRLNEEDKEYIERRIEEEGLTWSGVIHRLIEERTPSIGAIPEGYVLQKEYDELLERYEESAQGTGQIMSKKTWDDLSGMIRLMGYSPEKFFELIREMLNDGQIYQEGLVLKTKGSVDTRELEEICHRMNVEPEDMIKKFIKGISR